MVWVEKYTTRHTLTQRGGGGGKSHVLFCCSFFTICTCVVRIYLDTAAPAAPAYLSTLMVTSFLRAPRGTIPTHVLTFFPFKSTSQVPHSPFLQLYLMGILAARATSFRFCPATAWTFLLAGRKVMVTMGGPCVMVNKEGAKRERRGREMGCNVDRLGGCWGG